MNPQQLAQRGGSIAQGKLDEHHPGKDRTTAQVYR